MDNYHPQELFLFEPVHMDETFIASIVMDIIRGMTYLHKNSSIGVHGNLKSSNCLVTSRWVVKLSGFGLPNIRNKFKEDRGKTTFFIKLYNLWLPTST